MTCVKDLCACNIMNAIVKLILSKTETNLKI